MKPQVLAPTLDALDALIGVDAFCCFVTEDERPLTGAAGLLDFRLCGAFSRVLKQGFFTGTPGERLLMPTERRVTPAKVFAVGLGTRSVVTALGLEHALAQSATMLGKAHVSSVVLAFPTLPPAVATAVDELVNRAFAPSFVGAVSIFG